MEKLHGRKLFKIAGMVFAGIGFAVLFAFAFGLVVQHLWNYLIPDLFGLKAITYWQAFALVILLKILFGAFGSHFGHHGRSRWRTWPHQGCNEYRDWNIPRENKQYYKDFWRDEGCKAFEEYVKRVESAVKSPGE